MHGHPQQLSRFQMSLTLLGSLQEGSEAEEGPTAPHSSPASGLLPGAGAAILLHRAVQLLAQSTTIETSHDSLPVAEQPADGSQQQQAAPAFFGAYRYFPPRTAATPEPLATTPSSSTAGRGMQHSFVPSKAGALGLAGMVLSARKASTPGGMRQQRECGTVEAGASRTPAGVFAAGLQPCKLFWAALQAPGQAATCRHASRLVGVHAGQSGRWRQPCSVKPSVMLMDSTICQCTQAVV